MNNNIPIFCINLERATERREKIQKEWIDDLGLDIIFWKAYDRRNIEANQLVYPYNKDKALKFMGRELNSGEIACSTSFCMLYEHIINSSLKEVIIMEDDIMPLIKNKNELYDCIYKGKLEFPTVNIFLLHKSPKFQVKNKKIFSLCDKAPWGTQFFYANNKGITNLYQLLKPMIYTADYPQKILASKLQVALINNPLCSHNWNGPLSTTYIGRHKKRIFIP